MQILKLIGSKTNLSNSIIELFPKHKTYVEVFGGTGIILLKKEPSKIEVYNDLNEELCLIFNVIKHNPKELIKKIKEIPHNKSSFEELKNIYKSVAFYKLSNIEKASILFSLINISILGRKISFAGIKGESRRRDIENFNKVKKIETVSARLKNVKIYNEHFKNIINKYDSKKTLFYCDPPYVNFEDYYNGMKSMDEHELLSKLLLNIQGNFILSYYYDEEMLNFYSGCYIINKVRNKCSASGKSKKDNTLLIMNFKPKVKNYEVIDVSCI